MPVDCVAGILSKRTSIGKQNSNDGVPTAMQSHKAISRNLDKWVTSGCLFVGLYGTLAITICLQLYFN